MDSLVYIGLMSGTSADGLDVCAATFNGNAFHILRAETYCYTPEQQHTLLNAHKLSALELAQLDVDFGKFCGQRVHEFTEKYQIKAHYVASHGQTVFHTPNTGLTLQIGSGAHIAAQSGITTICDFRSLDVAHGGQGAPLVPIGDELLFPEYTYCLNIGGFANVSTAHNGKRIAWDVCPSNIVLNKFAEHCGQAYDCNGTLGRQGSVNEALLRDLNAISYYAKEYPKSLGREWVDDNITPLFAKYDISNADKMRTYYEHCALQIGNTLKGKGTTLCTGGGAHNAFLMELIQSHAESTIVIPEALLIDYKEALLFAYLGYLRTQEKPNCLASVTGANKDVCGGAIYCA